MAAKSVKGGTRRRTASTSSDRAPRSRSPRSSTLTISLPELLVAGSDIPFRQFVADIFAAVAGMQALRRALAASVDLSAGEFSVLLAAWHLQSKGRVGISTVANHLHVAAANITVDVATLARAGFLQKTQRSQDSRAVDLAVTSKGETLLGELAPLLRQINDRLFAGNTQDSIAIVARFLRQVAHESANAIRMARSRSRHARS